MSQEKVTFSFGKNWEEFVKSSFSEERVEIAKDHILNFLELKDMRGRCFLDVGCGSGLHSLAALKAKAERIVSFDVDEHAVTATRRIREMYGNPSNWEVLHGSILDQQFISNIEPADIVYSWGVLHHTGKMWEAIENTAELMRNDGLLYMALYTTNATSKYWFGIKKKYNRASRARKRLMECWYVVVHLLIAHCVKLKNPLKTVLQRKQHRGMSYLTDLRDWLGGYPFEYAKIEEVLQFCRKRLGLELADIRTGRANTEYLFKRR